MLRSLVLSGFISETFRRPFGKHAVSSGSKTSMYENLQLYIDGKFTPGQSGASSSVLNPANDQVLSKLPHAKKPELDAALAAADKGFKISKSVSAYERAKILRKAADMV